MQEFSTDPTATWYNASGAVTSGANWLNAVRLQTVPDKDGTIYYLDFNSAVFEAVNGLSGSDATILTKIKTYLETNTYWNTKGISEQGVLDTVEGIFQALNNMPDDKTGKNTYRVLRAHHPPFNLEGDYVGMFSYKSKTGGKTFIQACKAAKVHLYLASHHHSAQLWSFDYAGADTLPTIVKGSDTKPKKEVQTGSYTCWNTKDKAKCDAYTLDTKGSLTSPKTLYVALIGNSGRYFDPITDANISYGNFLFGRASNPEGAGALKISQAKNKYGGAILTIDSGAFKVEIYESGSTTAVATLKVTHDPSIKRRNKMKKAKF
jgi:hypothetical protein